MASQGGVPLARSNDPTQNLFQSHPSSLSLNKILGSRPIRTCRKDKNFGGSDKGKLASVKEVERLDSSTVSSEQETFRKCSLEERIQSKRKIKHQITLLDKKDALDTIESEIQEELAMGCEALKTGLSETEDEITDILTSWKEPEVLAVASYSDVRGIGTSLEKIFRKREELIREFEELGNVKEGERIAKVMAVLVSTASDLYSIAFELPADIDKMIESESNDINMAVLSNQRQYTLLCESLMKDHLHLRKHCSEGLDRIYHLWSEAQCQLQEEKFSGYMGSGEVVEPPVVQELVDKLHQDQEMINSWRIELLLQLGSLNLAGHNKTAIYEWKEQYSKQEEKLDEIHSTFLSEWQKCQDMVQKQCEGKMEEVQEYLVSSSVLESSKSYEFLTQRCLPLVESHQSRVTEQFKNIQRSLSSVSSTHQTQFNSLFQYALGGAHILDAHLSEQDALLRNKEAHLNSTRSEHDLENQTMEANLDIVLDRLRQSSCDEELDEYLKLALKMLQNIRDSYIAFHDLMMSVCQLYPSEIREELVKYDNRVCEYFGVSRKPPSVKKNPKTKQHGKSPSAAKKSETPKMTKRPAINQHMTTPIVFHSASSPATPLSPLRLDTQLEVILQEVLSTNNGTSFYMYTRADSHVNENQAQSSVFMTQSEDLEGVNLVGYVTKALTIEEARFTEAKRSFCINFLDHLETHKTEVTQRANEFMDGKTEELKTELELRLHLHKPRPSRVKHDIHDIRKAELVAHQERLVKHVKGVTATIQQQKHTVQTIPDKLDELYDKLSSKLSNFKKELPKAKSSISLKELLNIAEGEYKRFVTVLNNMVDGKRKAVYEALDGLISSNNDYLCSLKLFSEGGNYCQQETESIVPRLEKQVQRIGKTRQGVAVELESIEQSVARRCQEIYSISFETSFHHHLIDVTFIETINSKLAHCQLLIKTEVLASNSQSKEITQAIYSLRDDFFSDDGTKQFSDLCHALPPLFELFSGRVQYLYCRALGHPGSLAGGKDGPEIPTNVAMATGPISAINVTKSILNYTTGRDEDQTNTKPIASGTVKQGKRKKQQLLERKQVSYGVGGGEEGTGCFLPCVRSALKTVHRELYAFVEEYYKRKSNRSITRMDQIADTFEQTMDSLIDRLQGYRKQAEEYRNQCIDELHDQLESLYQTLSSVIELMYERLSENNQLETIEEIDQLTKCYYDEMKTLSEAAKFHQEDRLRPCLGHPSKASELRELNTNEEERFQQALDTIKRNNQTIQEVLMNRSRQFVSVLTEDTQQVLRALDGILTPGELVSRRPKPLPQEQLLRSVAQGSERALIESNKPLAQTDSPWPGIQDLTLAFGNRKIEQKMQTCIKQTNVTPVHTGIILARDVTLQKYQKWCVGYLQKWKETFKEERDKEEKIHSTWNESVSTIKKLYST